MAIASDRLFQCTVFPDTALRAIARAHGFAIGAVLLVGPTLWRLHVRLWCLPLVAIAVLVAYGMYGFKRSNPLVDFAREFEFHGGNNCPTDAVTAKGPLWLAVLLILVLGAGIVPLLRPIMAYCLLVGWFAFMARQTGYSFPTMLREHWNAVFTFLGYPDWRFSAPAGTAAVWIPPSSMLQRRIHIALLLIPFYLALGAGLDLGNYMWLQDKKGVADMVLLLPVPFFAVFALTVRSLLQLRSQTRRELEDFSIDWETCVARVRNSAYQVGDVGLSDHYFLGFVLPTREHAPHPLHFVDKWDLPSRTPALAHDSSFDGHMHIIGPTGINKTTLGQAPVAMQAIRGRSISQRDEDGNVIVGLDGIPLCQRSDPEPMVCIDLKGDLSLFWTFKHECEKRGQTFRFMTLQQGKATSFFSPLANLQHGGRPIIEFCEIVLNALDLFHGALDYGASYFSEQCRSLLLETLKKLKGPVQSWEQLYELLTETLDRRKHKDAYELLGRIYGLSHYPVLGAAPEGVDAIHFPDVIDRGEAVYLWLPALVGAMSVITVAKLAMFCYLDAAAKRKNSGKPRKKSWLFIDEAQVVCGQNMERIFQQASGSDVRLVISNHTLANLDTRDAPNFSATVWANTRIKQAFALIDTEDRDRWIALSGETLDYLTGFGQGTDGQGRATSSTTWQPVVHPRLNHNVLNAVGNTRGASLLYLIRDDGLARYEAIPQQIWCPFPLSKEEYERRMTTPWPDLPETKTQGNSTQTTVVNTQSPEEIEVQAEEKYAAIEELFRTVDGESGRQFPLTDH
jgi:hypothetical protein